MLVDKPSSHTVILYNRGTADVGELDLSLLYEIVLGPAKGPLLTVCQDAESRELELKDLKVTETSKYVELRFKIGPIPNGQNNYIQITNIFGSNDFYGCKPISNTAGIKVIPLTNFDSEHRQSIIVISFIGLAFCFTLMSFLVYKLMFGRLNKTGN